MHCFEFFRDFRADFLLASHSGIPAQNGEHALRSMLRDPDFQSHLALRYYSERDTARRYAPPAASHAVLMRVRPQVRD